MNQNSKPGQGQQKNPRKCPYKQVIISAMLDDKIESQLIHFLRDNNDIFAWSAEDLRGVDRSIIEHILEVNQNSP